MAKVTKIATTATVVCAILAVAAFGFAGYAFAAGEILPGIVGIVSGISLALSTHSINENRKYFNGKQGR